MIGDLPELSNIFNEDPKDGGKTKDTLKDLKQDFTDEEISVFISKDNGKWIQVNFLDLAPSNIGIHIILPIDMDITFDDLSNFKIKFEDKRKDEGLIIKEIQILIRWQEKDQISGRVKLGLHFHGDNKNDPDIIKILDKLKKK